MQVPYFAFDIISVLKLNYTSFTDNELAGRVRQKDDQDAFSELYDRYAENILMYLSKMINEQEDAEDIVQDIFVSFWNRRSEIEFSTGFSSYLYGAARRAALHALRSNNNREKIIKSFAVFFDGYTRSPHSGLVAKELESLFDRETGRLAPQTKEVFVLSRRENLSHKQIASRLGISDKTVKKQINNALKQFRLRLNEELFTLTFLVLTTWLK